MFCWCESGIISLARVVLVQWSGTGRVPTGTYGALGLDDFAPYFLCIENEPSTSKAPAERYECCGSLFYIWHKLIFSFVLVYSNI